MKAAAVFLDRDGTIIEDPGYIGDPNDVRLLPGAAGAICRLSRAGYVVVVISNQSGVARGLFDEKALSGVHSRFEALLKVDGANLDGAYYCPYLDGSEAKVDAYRLDSELRKPRPGMLLQAARELGIELSRSWMVGDSATDVEAGRRAGCRTILIGGDESTPSPKQGRETHAASDLADAVDIIERETRRESDDMMTQKTKPHARDESLLVLEQIHQTLERNQHRERQQDFSLLRLFGALSQMCAIVAAIWGLSALFDDRAAMATARLTLACFLQIVSISTFAVDRFR